LASQDSNWYTFLSFTYPTFFSSGYSYKVFKQTLNGGEPYLPEWEDHGDLFFQGLKIFIIAICYFIVPIVLSWAGLFYLIMGVLEGMQGPSKHIEIVDYILKGELYYSLSFITSIPSSILWPMAFANYSKNNEKIWAAFKLWEIIPKISIVFRDCILALVLIILTRIFLFFLLFLVLALYLNPLLFFLIILTYRFYFNYLVYNALFGSVCSKAYPDEFSANPSLPKIVNGAKLTTTLLR
jgi:Protein of unknown function (DUF4013)